MIMIVGKRLAAIGRCSLVLSVALLLPPQQAHEARAQRMREAPPSPTAAPPQGLNERRAPRAPRERGAGRGNPLFRILNLSEEQKAQIRAIRQESEGEWQAIRRRLLAAHRALDEAIYSETADEAVIEQRAREVGAAQAALMRMRALTELRIRRVLTPEQLNTLRELRRRARERRPERPPETGEAP